MQRQAAPYQRIQEKEKRSRELKIFPGSRSSETLGFKKSKKGEGEKNKQKISRRRMYGKPNLLAVLSRLVLHKTHILVYVRDDQRANGEKKENGGFLSRDVGRGVRGGCVVRITAAPWDCSAHQTRIVKKRIALSVRRVFSFLFPRILILPHRCNPIGLYTLVQAPSDPVAPAIIVSCHGHDRPSMRYTTA